MVSIQVKLRPTLSSTVTIKKAIGYRRSVAKDSIRNKGLVIGICLTICQFLALLYELLFAADVRDKKKKSFMTKIKDLMVNIPVSDYQRAIKNNTMWLLLKKEEELRAKYKV